MAKTDFQTMDEYIETFPVEVQKILEKVRATIQKAVPDAEETINYQIPVFKYHGWIFYFSAYKQHYALACPPPFSVFAAFKKELSRYEVSKSSIKFPFDEPVPVKLIADMAKFQAKENLKKSEKPKKKPKPKK